MQLNHFRHYHKFQLLPHKNEHDLILPLCVWNSVTLTTDLVVAVNCDPSWNVRCCSKGGKKRGNWELRGCCQHTGTRDYSFMIQSLQLPQNSQGYLDCSNQFDLIEDIGLVLSALWATHELCRYALKLTSKFSNCHVYHLPGTWIKHIWERMTMERWFQSCG